MLKGLERVEQHLAGKHIPFFPVITREQVLW
jgi:hypothetical protein